MCGSTVNLEFDHVDSKDKSFAISRNMSYNFSEIQNEINKCQLLCRQCHIKKSKRENDICAKIDADIAISICEEYTAMGMTQTEIGNRYGLTQSAVGLIVRGERWGTETHKYRNCPIVQIEHCEEHVFE